MTRTMESNILQRGDRMKKALYTLLSLLLFLLYVCFVLAFTYDNENFAQTISDNMAIDSDGDFLMRMGGNMAMGMDTGDLHFISS